MGIFGWSYPAGCSGPPDDDIDTACPNCGKEPGEDDEWVYCSEACKTEYAEKLRKESQMEALAIDAWTEEEKALAQMLAEWDSRDDVGDQELYSFD